MLSPDCVLIHAGAFHRHDACYTSTAASARTSTRFPIELYLSCPAPSPLLPTFLFVNVPCVDFTKNPPCIVRAVEDLILLRVPEGRRSSGDEQRWPRRSSWEEEQHDYFIYRPGGPSLKRLPRPPHPFHDKDVGLLRRGEDHYIVAALIPSYADTSVYNLHRYDSATDKWTVDEVSFPEKHNYSPKLLFYHFTTTVITIGGEGGTMGWVDLWNGILLCDLLTEDPKLRGIPLPMPVHPMIQDECGCPKSRRGITATETCIKFVHLGVDAVPVPFDPDADPETFQDDWEMRDWTITTWSNTGLSTDWHMDSEVKASCTTVSSKLEWKLLNYGLVSPAGGGASFQNILVTFPVPGIQDDVVYLQARLRFRDPKVFVLALDTKDNKLLGAVEFATERTPMAGVEYFPSNIGKYIGPRSRCLPIPKDDSNWEELTKYEGTEWCTKTFAEKFGHLFVQLLLSPRVEEPIP